LQGRRFIEEELITGRPIRLQGYVAPVDGSPYRRRKTTEERMVGFGACWAGTSGWKQAEPKATKREEAPRGFSRKFSKELPGRFEGRIKEKRGRFAKQFPRNLNFVPKLFYKYIGFLVLIPIRKGEEGLLQNHTSEIKIEFTKNNNFICTKHARL
jgi:hypothetical protein